MPASNDQISNLDAELDALSSPTTADTYVVSKDYDPDIVAASATRRALAGGGGGAAPTTHEELYGGNLEIADGDTDSLNWNTSGGPDSLLDLSTPAIPTVIVAGVYSFQVSVKSSAMTADGYFAVQLKLDGAGFDASAFSDSRLASSLGNALETSVSFAWYMPAGARVQVFVVNHDGANAVFFHINVAHVQRLS